MSQPEKCVQLKVFLTHEEHKLLSHAVVEKGTTLKEFIRDAALAAARQEWKGFVPQAEGKRKKVERSHRPGNAE